MLELITTISVILTIIFGILFQIVLSDLSHEKEQRQRTSTFYEELKAKNCENLNKISELEKEIRILNNQNQNYILALERIHILSDLEKDEEDDD